MEEIRKKWKICIEKPFKNCDLIYPIQQKYVKTLIESLKKNENVNKIIIFGSSVTGRCNIDSDIDIYLELKEEKKVKFPYISKAYDYWNNFTANDHLKKEILRKGILVYENNS